MLRGVLKLRGTTGSRMGSAQNPVLHSPRKGHLNKMLLFPFPQTPPESPVVFPKATHSSMGSLGRCSLLRPRQWRLSRPTQNFLTYPQIYFGHPRTIWLLQILKLVMFFIFLGGGGDRILRATLSLGADSSRYAVNI